MKDQKNPFNYLFYMLTIFVIGSILFLTGFFPLSKNVIGIAEKHYNSVQANKLDEYILQKPEAKYNQIILIIIDAWRSDHPNATNMPFTYSNACDHLNIKVDIPTVTMPRLKSITTGTISNFIDIVLNLGHISKLDDSILHRLAEKNKKSVFAGDRTWIQLFPSEFLRTVLNNDSFFVNDFYEGDTNVTNALKVELGLSDWHLMVLHYLGLDHIGHVEGSHSDKIFSKLFEMDSIVKYISTNVKFSKKLLLLTGDHGMRNGGSHGGSSEEELNVPLMTFHDSCVKQKWSNIEYNQIDVAATLAVLLDVEIPFTSVGCLIPEMLECYSKEEQLFFYYYNTLHLMEKWKSRFNLEDEHFKDYTFWYKEAKTSHKEFLSSHGTSFLSYEKAKQNYIRLSKTISHLLSDSLVGYDMFVIIISLCLTTFSSTKLIMNVLFENSPIPSEEYGLVRKKILICLSVGSFIYILAHYYHILDIQSFNSFLFIFPIALGLHFATDVIKLLLKYLLIPLIQNRKIPFRLNIPVILLLFFLCHTFSLASSSFIEEEHQTWYYFTPSLLLFLTLTNFYNGVKRVWQEYHKSTKILREVWNLRFILVVMISIIVCRRLNQTGDKWRHLVDIGDILSRNENHLYLTLTLLTGLILLLLFLRKLNSTFESILCFVSLSCVFIYRQQKEHSSFVLIAFWISVIFTAFKEYRNIFCKRKNHGYNTKGNLVELLKTNLTCCLLISALLHKPHNVILLPAVMNTLEKSYYLCDNMYLKDKRVYNRSYALTFKTVITIFIANMFYFFQGNSNCLTTVDLNPGYIGLSTYNPLVVGLLITLNTYCAHINSFLYLMYHMFVTQRNMLPLRQEKEQISNVQLLESTEEDLYLVYSLFTATTIMPIAVYWCLLVGFRYHLFIYSVFAPKAIYECFHLLVFYINFIVTNLYFRIFIK